MKELRTYKIDDNLEKYGSIINKDSKMNEQFYNTVMSDVDSTKEGAFLAYDIYNSFNKKVRYDEVFSVFEQDTSLDFINDIYTKKAEEITEENNAVTCVNWAESFAYMLMKNGFDAVIDKEVKHHQVYFKASNHIFRADATGKILGTDEKNQMSDLTRAKLGVASQGFLIYEENKKGVIEEKKFLQSEFYKNNTKGEQSQGIEEYTMRILQELKQDEAFYSFDIPEEYHNTFSSIALISEMLENSKLDTIGGITYLKHLMKVLIKEEDQKKITLDHIKIQNEETEILNVDEINYGVILTYTPEEVENPRYCFFHPSVSGYNFLYTGQNNLSPISEEEAYHLQEQSDDIELKVEEHDYKRGGK